MKNHKLILLLMAFWCLSFSISVAHAQTYKWTDEHGRVSFTDDLSNVPEKYRKSAISIGEPVQLWGQIFILDFA